MLGFLTVILLCQLGGELVVGALNLPIPGPVMGMAILFVILILRGDVPKGLEDTANGLLRMMSLLFVPAGTGVILHFQLIGQALLPLSLALILSTTATIAITALLMRWLSKPEAQQDG
ncbi:CidA/LrgA family protein [Epibacterium sp. SM1969]|uniref:CidA/LrgA family protein n=1 Tax=Tritonibacter aquimaris TaxID=2663379 RepID=A0A844AK75_9RHOB|nr:CidA/LrgA family protein [Tritonibacter aquimaris]MQY41635.1 CidA/LrgA family protein [Tritonibacter aquimaris]